MAETNGNGKGMSGTCSMCGGGMNGCACGHRCHWGWGILRVVVALFVLAIIFWMGVMIGELRALTGGFRGARMMSAYGTQQSYPMMGVPGATTSAQ